MYKDCTSVTPDCPVGATTYGYAPNLGANVFFTAFFGCCMIAQVILGIRGRTWSFMVAVGIGSFGEMVGYIGRILMHDNPWSTSAFEVQICCLILAPSFLAAGIYLSLKHLILQFGPEHSRLRPTLYTWLFVGCDIFSIILQASGGGLASTHQYNLIKIGNNVIVAGIAFQVCTMAVCGILGIEYFIRLHKSERSELRSSPPSRSGPNEEKPSMHMSTKRTKAYVIAAAVAFVTIFVRCVYRVPEMAGGWGGPLMRKENEFIVLDGTMIAIATLALTVFHPTNFFPQMGKR